MNTAVILAGIRFAGVYRRITHAKSNDCNHFALGCNIARIELESAHHWRLYQSDCASTRMRLYVCLRTKQWQRETARILYTCTTTYCMMASLNQRFSRRRETARRSESVEILSTATAAQLFNKSSAVAEMGDRGHNRHGPKGGGCCAHFAEHWEPV